MKMITTDPDDNRKDDGFNTMLWGAIVLIFVSMIYALVWDRI